MSDPVVQWQMIAKDPEATVRFYSGLFGWTVTASNALGYREVDTGVGGTPGGIWPSPPDGQNMVQLFVAVSDVAQSAAKAAELGATVIVPATALPDGDTIAILADPSGMTFGMMARR